MKGMQVHSLRGQVTLMLGGSARYTRQTEKTKHGIHCCMPIS